MRPCSRSDLSAVFRPHRRHPFYEGSLVSTIDGGNGFFCVYIAPPFFCCLLNGPINLSPPFPRRSCTTSHHITYFHESESDRFRISIVFPGDQSIRRYDRRHASAGYIVRGLSVESQRHRFLHTQSAFYYCIRSLCSWPSWTADGFPRSNVRMARSATQRARAHRFKNQIYSAVLRRYAADRCVVRVFDAFERNGL